MVSDVISPSISSISSPSGIMLAGAKVYGENSVLENGVVAVNAGKICAIESQHATKFSATQVDRVFTFPATWHVIPGLIDMHLHGGYGADTMDATCEALATVSRNLPQEGVTAFLATTITQSASKIAAALSNAHTYQLLQNNGCGAELLGLYLESPFIAPNRGGAQPQQHILAPDIELLRAWHALAGASLSVITIAPEIAGANALIAYALQHNIIPAVGHTNATYAEACSVLTQIGAVVHAHATHLFNAMPPLLQRAPGAVTALLLDPYATVELIADGVHLHPAMLQLALRLKGRDKVILISDAMRAKGLPAGEYEFGGQKVNVADGVARLEDGTLAGSVLTMDEAIRNIMKFTGVSLADTIQMASMNPARRLGVAARKGSLMVGKDADIVVLDEDYRVRLTLCAGRVCYHKS